MPSRRPSERALLRGGAGGGGIPALPAPYRAGGPLPSAYPVLTRDGISAGLAGQGGHEGSWNGSEDRCDAIPARRQPSATDSPWYDRIMALIKWKAIKAELGNVDQKDVLERAKDSPALWAALEMSRPRNWWGIGIPPERLINLAHGDGIPVVWVPSSAILVALDSASTREARLEILRVRRNEILEECSNLIAACDDPWMDDMHALALRALDAFRTGHHEAAMALAVSLGEPLATWASTPRVRMFSSEEDKGAWERKRNVDGKYRWAAEELSGASPVSHQEDIYRQALIAPIPAFFKPFRVEKGDPVPAGLSRHAVAHHPTRAHFSPENALLALMLITSFLREMANWCQEVRLMDAPVDDSH